MFKLSRFYITNLLLIAMSFNLVSCGDLSSEPEDKPAIVQGLQACGADLNAFSNFFNERTQVQEQLDCLHEDLNLFMDFVESSKPGYLPLENLIQYLQQDPESNYDEDMGNVIRAFFDITHLIVGGDKGFISRKNVDDIVKLLKFVNDEAVKVYDLIKNSPEDPDIRYALHQQQREIIRKTLLRMQEEVIISGIFNNSERRFLDLKVLIERFETQDNSLAIEKTLSLLFAKKAILGGDQFKISNDQLFNITEAGLCTDCLFGKIIDLGMISFDIAKIKKIIFNSQGQELGFYQRIARGVKGLLFDAPVGSSTVTTVEDVSKAVDLLLPDLVGDGVALQSFNENIKELKDVLFGDKNSRISFEEVHNLIDYGLEILDMGIYFNSEYIANADKLNGPRRISEELADCDGFSRNSMEDRNCKRFNRIALNYRYFGGVFKLPYFTDHFHRNMSGFFEIGLIERLLESVFLYYDDDDQDVSNRRPSDGDVKDYQNGINANKSPEDYDLYLRQIRVILKRFSGLLNEIGVVVPGRIFGREDIASSDNVVLMSSLFQNQSNGSDSKDRAYVDVPEFTELAISLLSAINLKDFFSEKMLELCAGDLIDGKVSPECFRRNFSQVIDMNITGSRDSIADYLPKLSNYINQLNEKDLYEYVKESEEFTKMCMNFSLTADEFSNALSVADVRSIDYSMEQGEEIPLSKTDMFAVFAGLFNVESTLNRFDVNNDNKMNPSEVDTAFYEVYQGVLRNISKLGTKGARRVFHFLVHKERSPTKLFEKIQVFTGIPKVKRVSATRKKMASILTTIGEQSDSNSTDNKCFNPYCCDVFRQVIDSETGQPRDLNSEEFEKVVGACRVKFRKADPNYQYPYDICERI